MRTHTLSHHPRFLSPFTHTRTHTETKGHWARDDPAFFIIQVLLLLAASTAWSAAFAPSVAAALWAPLRAVVLVFLGLGALAATLGWALAGALADRTGTATGTGSGATGAETAAGHRAEWAYCFDVHCNGFFPLFVALHVGAYLVAPLLLARSIGPVATLMSNALCAAAAVHYCYVTFLGYQTLGTLRDARVFLLPVPLVVVAAVVASLLGVNTLALTLRLIYH